MTTKLNEMRGSVFTRLIEIFNSLLLPIKLVIPQPIIARLPYLTTNEDIRIYKALEWLRGYTLDIGCGTNRLIREYRQRGGKGLGVDVYDWGGQDLTVQDTAKLPFEKTTFDTVSMLACINHIPNREEVLRETHRILKSDGRLVLTNLTPFVSEIWHKYAFWDEDRHERGIGDGEVYGLTKIELDNLMNGADFAVEAKKTFSWGLNTIYRYCKKFRSYEITGDFDGT